MPGTETAVRRGDIQGLRGIAVALVVAWHAQLPGMSGGYVGVDVFFVISGYVITLLLIRESAGEIRKNLAAFYRRRVLRLLPAATLVLVATTLVDFWFAGPLFDSRLLTDVRWAALFAGNVRFIETNSDYFLAGVEPSLVMHFWSLAVEEQFYLCYPILLFTAMKWSGAKWRVSAMRTLLLAAVTASALCSALLTASNPVAAYYSPLTRFWELGLGGLLALAPACAVRGPQRAALSAAAIAALAVSVTTFNSRTSYPGTAAWIPCLAAGALLWAGSGTASGPGQRVLGTRPLVWLGDISYSLYLWHFAWLVIPTELAIGGTGVPWMALGTIGAVTCAAGSYYLLENPIRHSPRLAQDGVSVMLLLVLCVLVIWDATLLVHWRAASP